MDSPLGLEENAWGVFYPNRKDAGVMSSHQFCPALTASGVLLVAAALFAKDEASPSVPQKLGVSVPPLVVAILILAVVVSVVDSGRGLQEANVDRLFEPFYTTKSNGMGMGLAICRSIISAHKGRLWATPNVPRGAVFQFTLPCGRETSTGVS
jgi:signal transduction histidine kinase